MRTVVASHSNIRRCSPLIISLLLAFIIVAFTPRQLWAAETCFAVADEGDQLVTLNKSSGAPGQIGATGVLDIEAMAFKNDTTELYAADAGDFGTLNIVSGTYTSLGPIGSLNSVSGTIPVNDVDSLSWDPIGAVFYGALRRVVPPNSGFLDETEPDLLFQIDPATGKVKAGAFAGADYVTIGVTTRLEADIDDITFHPILSDTLYGIANDGGKAGTLVTIDKFTGAITEIGQIISETLDITGTTMITTVIDDMEGLSFFNDGQLYGSTGGGGPDPKDANQLFKIDIATGKATLVGKFPAAYSDYEALACLTAQIADDDGDGLFNIGEDINGNGNLADDDSDGDGIPNYADEDDDNDTVLSKVEDINVDGSLVNDDTDGDTILNYLDTDDDGDTIFTKDERRADLGNVPPDFDNDGAPDYLESNNLDTDQDGNVNQLDDDDDGDGVSTLLENLDGIHGPMNEDTDLDGIANFMDKDDDGDGVPTRNEYKVAAGDDVDNDGTLNYLDTDSDGDGLLDSYEWSENESPSDLLRSCVVVDAKICTTNDVDDDGMDNFLDRDSDGDGKTDRSEFPLGDTDGDGIPDWLDKFDFGSGSGDGRIIYMPIIAR